MVYEFRTPVDYKFGQLDTAITATAVTLSSPQFASLPSPLSTSFYIPMVLTDDAQAVKEIVWITAHASNATTVTVVRAREGSTGRIWGSGTNWAIGPTARDVTPHYAWASFPSDAHTGMLSVAEDLGMPFGKSYSQGFLPLLGMGDPRHQGNGQSAAHPANSHCLVPRAGWASPSTDGSGFSYIAWSTAFPNNCLAVTLQNRDAALFSGWFVVQDQNATGVSFKAVQPGVSGGVTSPTSYPLNVIYFAIGW